MSDGNKVSDLIALLNTLDPDALVVMSKDGEGNQYTPWSGDYLDTRYSADSSWSGEIEDADEPWDSDGVDCVKAVVLWPTN
jgi:hypothetical protein